MTTAIKTRIIDGDGHVIEGDLGPFLPEPYKGRSTLGLSRGTHFPPVDHLHNEPVQTLPGSFNPAGPTEWAQFLDDAGVDFTVMYPSLGLSIGNVASRDWATALCQGYNNWLHQTYTSVNPRFKGMALIPMQDVGEAVNELRRAVTELGMLGAMLPGNGLKGSLGQKDYWPVYAEAERLGCSLAIHSGPHHKLGLDNMDVYPPIHALGHPFALMIACGSMIFNGVFDRFPGLRVAFLEGGVSWLLLVLERFDRSYETHIPYNPRGELLNLRPGQRVSDYLKELINDRRFFVGCEGEEPTIGDVVRYVGNKPFMFSSDYPHEVNTEMCKHEISEILEHATLQDEDKRAILAENALHFYGLPA
ncbi:MAG: amidohydrolase family protein [Chloroflexota bacterium]